MEQPQTIAIPLPKNHLLTHNDAATITDELRKLLNSAALSEDGSPSTFRLEVAKKILKKCLDGDDKFIKLALAYMEGAPTQKVETTINQNVVHTVFTPEQIMSARKKAKEVLNELESQVYLK